MRRSEDLEGECSRKKERRKGGIWLFENKKASLTKHSRKERRVGDKVRQVRKHFSGHMNDLQCDRLLEAPKNNFTDKSQRILRNETV